MKSRTSFEDPAFPLMAMDILGNVLSRSDNPGGLGTYLTEEIRNLTGARCVLLIQCLGTAEAKTHRVVNVNPARRRKWAESPEGDRLYEIVQRQPKARLWRGGELSDAAGLPRQEGFELSMTLPLNVGASRVGALFVLGLPDEEHVTSVLELLNDISAIVALVLRISLLYENQEQIIRDRTAELSTAAEKYRTLIECANDAVFIHEIRDDGMPGPFIEVNESACRQLGYNREELARLSPLELDDPRYRDRIDKAMDTLRRDGRAVFETAQMAKDGRSIPVEVSTRVLDMKGTRLLFSIVRDITERMRADEALRRMNRELLAIGNCNKALLRITEEHDLIEEICRIICDEAGYRMAWVGFVENDAAKTIRPAAWAGFESGYIAGLKLTWADDSERGRGPAGTAVRSGKTIFVQDFRTDPRMSPWREDALKRGYRSGISIPLKDNEARVIGILLIYSGETNAITEDEVRLLEELADDLAFGISASRIRSERLRVEAARDAVYKISEIAHVAENMDDLFRTIQAIISDLMPAKNFYIALYDPENQMIRFPYFADEYEATPAPQPLGRGLTEYVLLRGEALLADPQTFQDLEKAGVVENVGAPSFDWLGVPLKVKKETIGVMAVQSYTEGVHYTVEDKEMLMFVSSQVALSIERRRAEDTLRESRALLQKSLSEKDALLKEIHHRVKNNMQIISSLIHLQAGQIEQAAVKEIFQVAQDRIRTISLVHEKLYQASDLSRINFADYVESLAVHLFQLNQIGADRIRLRLNLESLSFDIQTAIPLGLILNELITNTIKYAYPDGRAGELTLVLRSLDHGRFEMIVRDDGMGIPPSVDLESPHCFGWSIIRLLVGQIDGSIEIRREGGTEVRILFKEPYYKARI